MWDILCAQVSTTDFYYSRTIFRRGVLKHRMGMGQAVKAGDGCGVEEGTGKGQRKGRVWGKVR